MNILNEIEYDDLTDDMKMLHDLCGKETVVKLLENFGGLSFYIPKLTSFESLIYRFIRQNIRLSDKKIAVALGVSEQYIKTLKKKYN